MMLMSEMIEVSGANPIVSIDEVEICKAEKMYVKEKENK